MANDGNRLANSAAWPANAQNASRPLRRGRVGPCCTAALAGHVHSSSERICERHAQTHADFDVYSSSLRVGMISSSGHRPRPFELARAAPI